MMRTCSASLVLLYGAICSTWGLVPAGDLRAEDELPRSRDPRLKIELFAESPQIVTPTGIDVDHRGRVWAIESNTHFPPADYKGHTSDRVLVMRDTQGDGKADEIVTFLDGLTHTMSVAVRPNDDVYLATRKEILLCRDENGDGQCDSQKRIMHLETTGNYPHNGLAGFAFDALGWMYFGFGENLGADYKIIGADGTTLTGGGEGGNVYRCRLDGTELSRWATGFWNPHASCFDGFGRLFTVDNDPDSRPPCRLLHILRNGDYGYRFRNGRKGLHPFTSWNGEIPGTMPMVAGTGEAPSGIVAYESDGLPAEYVGNLLVTSWGDHRIDRFQLQPKGTSFTALAEPLITGGENFRPVGLAVAPDGSLYFTDWVLREYKLHGQGRVWRVSMKEPPQRPVIDVAEIKANRPLNVLFDLLKSPRIEVRRTAAQALVGTAGGRATLLRILKVGKNKRARAETFLAVANIPPTVLDVMSELSSIGRPEYDEVQALSIWLCAQRVPQFSEEADVDLATDYRMVAPQVAKFLKSGNSEWSDPTFLLASLANGNWLTPRFLTDSLQPNTPGQQDLATVFEEADPPLFAMLIDAQVRGGDPQPASTAIQLAKLTVPRARLVYLLASRRRNPREEAPLEAGLRDPDPQVRRAAVQWAAEEKLAQYRPQLAAILQDGSITPDLFLATVAGLEMLDGANPADIDKTPASKYVLPLIADASRPAPLRALALRIAAPAEPGLDAKLLASLLATDDSNLRLEAVRTLQLSPLPEAAVLLRPIAADEQQATLLRAEAIVGLAPALKTVGSDDPNRKLLEQLAAAKDPALRNEALRAFRGLPTEKTPTKVLQQLAEPFRNRPAGKLSARELELADQIRRVSPSAATLPQATRPEGIEPWWEQIREGGDAASGRRTFFHINSAGCYRCHTIEGRGGRVGPDLSLIARTMNRRKLAESILEPSKEISPQFAPWTVVMTSGQVHTGIILAEESERIQLGTSEGKMLDLADREIEERSPSKNSIMPDKLSEQLTIQEFRDLLAFLETLK